MKGHTKITAGHKRFAWRTVLSLTAVGCALALPAVANARPIDTGPYVVTSQSGVPNLNQATVSQTIGRPNEGFVTPDHLRYTGPVLATPSQPVSAGDGFDWSDAGIGAGAAFGLAVLAAGAVALRRRTGLSPSTS